MYSIENKFPELPKELVSLDSEIKKNLDLVYSLEAIAKDYEHSVETRGVNKLDSKVFSLSLESILCHHLEYKDRVLNGVSNESFYGDAASGALGSLWVIIKEIFDLIKRSLIYMYNYFTSWFVRAKHFIKFMKGRHSRLADVINRELMLEDTYLEVDKYLGYFGFELKDGSIIDYDMTIDFILDLSDSSERLIEATSGLLGVTPNDIRKGKIVTSLGDLENIYNKTKNSTYRNIYRASLGSHISVARDWTGTIHIGSTVSEVPSVNGIRISAEAVTPLLNTGRLYSFTNSDKMLMRILNTLKKEMGQLENLVGDYRGSDKSVALQLDDFRKKMNAIPTLYSRFTKLQANSVSSVNRILSQVIKEDQRSRKEAERKEAELSS